MTTTHDDAIIATGLVKTYGETRALDGVDLRVPRGTVLGLLGPNGAGKTTAVKVLTTQILPESGTATVDGIDVLANPHEVRLRIGLAGQYAAVDERLHGRENLVMIGQLTHLTRAAAERRAKELLQRFDLVHAADRPAKGYSGGMRRRLDLAASLVSRPPVLFLDEPTTGLDPRSRADLWDVIEELVTDGTSLLLTTQYLEEADRLADRIVVINHGKVIAEGTANELKREAGSESIDLTYADAATAARAAIAATGLEGVFGTSVQGSVLSLSVERASRSLGPTISEMRRQELHAEEIDLRRPTLDDVFLRLTGEEPRIDDAEDAPTTTGRGRR